MAYNEALTKRMREAIADGLTDRRKVEEKRMFRGVTFMVDGKMMASAGDDTFMFRIDPGMHDEAVEKEGVTGVVMQGRNYKGYVRVHENVVKSKRELDRWVKLALEFNMKVKVAPKRARK